MWLFTAVILGFVLAISLGWAVAAFQGKWKLRKQMRAVRTDVLEAMLFGEEV